MFHFMCVVEIFYCECYKVTKRTTNGPQTEYKRTKNGTQTDRKWTTTDFDFTKSVEECPINCVFK